MPTLSLEGLRALLLELLVSGSVLNAVALPVHSKTGPSMDPQNNEMWMLILGSFLGASLDLLFLVIWYPNWTRNDGSTARMCQSLYVSKEVVLFHYFQAVCIGISVAANDGSQKV